MPPRPEEAETIEALRVEEGLEMGIAEDGDLEGRRNDKGWSIGLLQNRPGLRRAVTVAAWVLALVALLLIFLLLKLPQFYGRRPS